MDTEWKTFDKEYFGEALRAVEARSPGPDPVAVRAALEEELAVILGAEPIGTLDDDDDARTLDGDLRRAERKKRPLTLEATIVRDEDKLGVRVFLP